MTAPLLAFERTSDWPLSLFIQFCSMSALSVIAKGQGFRFLPYL